MSSNKCDYEVYHADLQAQALDLSYKLRGLANLLHNYSPEGYGTEMEERENCIGVGMLVETLQKEAFDIYKKLDIVSRPSAETKAI